MKTFSEETKRRMSESAKKRAATPAFLNQVRAYWKPICSKEDLQKMYITEGMSQNEIAGLLGVTLKRVQTSMRRYDITPRPAIKRNQYGDKNTSWKGASATYKGCHLRVNRLRGKPQYCEKCHDTNPLKTYEWANMTGKYDDPSDYMRLCRSCHRQYDQSRREEVLNAV
jgi:hypothetical protein